MSWDADDKESLIQAVDKIAAETESIATSIDQLAGIENRLKAIVDFQEHQSRFMEDMMGALLRIASALEKKV
jgi:hypothetical protein